MPKTHPTYDSGFRQEAVNLLISSQRPLKAVAAELGVSANSLRTWRDRALHQGLAAVPGLVMLGPAPPKGCARSWSTVSSSPCWSTRHRPRSTKCKSARKEWRASAGRTWPDCREGSGFWWEWGSS